MHSLCFFAGFLNNRQTKRAGRQPRGQMGRQGDGQEDERISWVGGQIKTKERRKEGTGQGLCICDTAGRGTNEQCCCR